MAGLQLDSFPNRYGLDARVVWHVLHASVDVLAGAIKKSGYEAMLLAKLRCGLFERNRLAPGYLFEAALYGGEG